MFYVPKDKVVEAFETNGLTVDYSDKLGEADKSEFVARFESEYGDHVARDVANTLISLVGEATVNSYVSRVRAALSALPQQIRFISRMESDPVVFEDVNEATEFLNSPTFPNTTTSVCYVYQITYSDGTEFEQVASSLDQLRMYHSMTTRLTEHIKVLN